jgi:hypothetical protein
MPSTSLLIIQLLISLRTISATPVPSHHHHAKRSTAKQNVGSGFAIAICILFLAAIFYYLGTLHSRTKSWFSKLTAPAQPEPIHGSVASPAQRGHKRQISCPLAVSSSAPIKPYDDPIEAPAPSLRYYEMHVNEIHELGLPSPKKRPRSSWLELDRRPWWLKHGEKEQRGGCEEDGRKSMPHWFKSGRGSSSFVRGDASSRSSGGTRGSALQTGDAALSDTGRGSGGSSVLDWSGLDHVRRFYVERKSRIGL